MMFKRKTPCPSVQFRTSAVSHAAALSLSPFSLSSFFFRLCKNTQSLLKNCSSFVHSCIYSSILFSLVLPDIQTSEVV